MVKISLKLIKFDIISTPNVSQESTRKQDFTVKAWVAEQVDARDLKSLGVYPCTSSILVPGTNKNRKLKAFILFTDKRLFCSRLNLYITCTSF